MLTGKEGDNMQYLSDMLPGETGTVTDIEPCPLKGRLMDLGFFGKVRCLAKAPFGGPSAYLVRGSLIALRQEDARRLWVRRDG